MPHPLDYENPLLHKPMKRPATWFGILSLGLFAIFFLLMIFGRDVGYAIGLGPAIIVFLTTPLVGLVCGIAGAIWDERKHFAATGIALHVLLIIALLLIELISLIT